MTDTQHKSRARRTENEVAFKAQNQRVLKRVRQVMDASSKRELTLNFLCECANETCTETISLPADEFAHLRGNHKQFIALKGHDQPDIERVIRDAGNYIILEKYLTPPPAEALAS